MKKLAKIVSEIALLGTLGAFSQGCSVNRNLCRSDCCYDDSNVFFFSALGYKDGDSNRIIDYPDEYIGVSEQFNRGDRVKIYVHDLSNECSYKSTIEVHDNSGKIVARNTLKIHKGMFQSLDLNSSERDRSPYTARWFKDGQPTDSFQINFY